MPGLQAAPAQRSWGSISSLDWDYTSARAATTSQRPLSLVLDFSAGYLPALHWVPEPLPEAVSQATQPSPVFPPPRAHLLVPGPSGFSKPEVRSALSGPPLASPGPLRGPHPQPQHPCALLRADSRPGPRASRTLLSVRTGPARSSGPSSSAVRSKGRGRRRGRGRRAAAAMAGRARRALTAGVDAGDRKSVV